MHKSNCVIFAVEWKRQSLLDYRGIPQRSRKFWFEEKGVTTPNCVLLLVRQFQVSRYFWQFNEEFQTT